MNSKCNLYEQILYMYVEFSSTRTKFLVLESVLVSICGLFVVVVVLLTNHI